MTIIVNTPADLAALNAGMYMARLRNASKLEYAHNYFSWIVAGRKGAEPDRRQLLNGTLSYMAAQAVRTELDRIMGGQHE
jgi:hypothetical protein